MKIEICANKNHTHTHTHTVCVFVGPTMGDDENLRKKFEPVISMFRSGMDWFSHIVKERSPPRMPEDCD